MPFVPPGVDRGQAPRQRCVFAHGLLDPRHFLRRQSLVEIRFEIGGGEHGGWWRGERGEGREERGE